MEYKKSQNEAVGRNSGPVNYFDNPHSERDNYCLAAYIQLFKLEDESYVFFSQWFK